MSFKERIKAIFALALQLMLIAFPWYINIVVGGHYISSLSSMSALCSEARSNPGIFVDVIKNYACAQIAQDNPAKIWDLSSQANTINADLQAHQSDPSLTRRQQNWAQYTPQSVILLIPLTQLPLNQAIILFQIFSLAFLIVTVTILIRRQHHFTWQTIVLWWLIVLGTPAFLQNICLGQYAEILAGLAALFLLSWESKNVLLSSVCFALTAAIKPQHALIMLMMTLSAKRFRLLAGTIAVSIIFLGACVAVLGVKPVLSYAVDLAHIQSYIYQEKLRLPLEWTTAYTLGIPEFISFLLKRPVGHQLTLITAIADLVLLYFVWRTAVLRGRHTYAFAYAISILIDLLIGPSENFYDLFGITIAWAMTIPLVRLSQYSQLKAIPLRLWFLSFLFFPVASWLVSIYFLKVNGPIHMILLTFLLIIAITNFRRSLPAPTLAPPIV